MLLENERTKEIKISSKEKGTSFFDESDEIDLKELFFILWNKIHYIILCFLIGAVLVNFFTYLTIAPTYQSTAKMYVISAKKNALLDLTGLSAGTSIASDYKQLILSDTVMENVVRNLKLDMTEEELIKKIVLNNPQDTRILEITATTTNPELSRDIANEVMKVSMKYLPKTMSASSPNVAQIAKLMPQKVGPSYSKNTAVGGIVCMGLYCMYLFIGFIMDDTIKTPEDMEKYFGDAPLTVVPEDMSFKKYKYEKVSKTIQNKKK